MQNSVLIATITDPKSAQDAARKLKPDYFAEYAELSADQERIHSLMRGNRAPFLS